jgi:hypothetical protein
MFNVVVVVVVCHHHGWHHCCLFICSLIVHIIIQNTNYEMKAEYRDSFGYRRQNHVYNQCTWWEVHRKWTPLFFSTSYCIFHSSYV